VYEGEVNNEIGGALYWACKSIHIRISLSEAENGKGNM
jgi:hypothetical protein